MSLKILLVDDDPVARIYLGESLTIKGFDVTVFESGTEALEYSESNQVDVAIIDTYMPNMSGIELFAKLRQGTISKSIKVIIMSADRDCYDLLTKANLVADKVLLKPIKISTLLATLEEFKI